jgi:SWI/SNF-related matrix-associated actin-dependent regulator of chromatin subfamily A3
MKKEKHLGNIKSQIVGTQYYDSDVKGHEIIFFEREPDNTHDKNAIRGENLDFEKVGFLPKKTSSWLFPLIGKGNNE